MRRRDVITGLAAGFLPALAAARAFAARCEGVAPGARMQNTFAHDVGDEFDAIVARGWIEFAVYGDFAPYSWQEGSKAKGVDVGIGELIAQELKVEPRFRFVAAGENLDADLRNYVWKGGVVGGHVSNVMLHVPYDPQYACKLDQVRFTAPYFEEKVVIAYRDDAYPDGDKPTPAYFRYDTVGVENDSISDFYLTSMSNGQANKNIHRYPSTLAAMAALEKGEVKAVMGPRGEIQFGMGPGLSWHAPPILGFERGHWALGAAVHISHADLGYAVGDAIAAGLKDGRIADIFKRHGLSFSPPAV